MRTGKTKRKQTNTWAFWGHQKEGFRHVAQFDAPFLNDAPLYSNTSSSSDGGGSSSSSTRNCSVVDIEACVDVGGER